MKNRKFATAAFLSGVAWSIGLSPTAFAQDQSTASTIDSPSHSGDVGEIIVTAQRREQSIQKASVAISALGADDLAKTATVDATALTRQLPAVQFSNAGHAQNFFIRGIGSLVGNSLGDPAVALSVGGVFLARPYMLPGQFFDLERVEVLKGPQGTLYGRNATGGAVNLIPKAPGSENAMDLTLDVGNYDAIRAEAAANLALSPTVSVRGSFQLVSRDGYLDQGLYDDRHQSARLQVRWQPDDRLSVNLLGDYTHIDGKGAGSIEIHNFPQDKRVVTTDPRVLGILAQSAQTRLNNRPFVNDDLYGIAATVNYAADFGTFTFIPGYRKSHVRFGFQQGFNYRADENEHQTSGELRFSSKADGPFRYILGAYYLNENSNVDFAVTGGFPFPTPFGQVANFNIKTETYAFFGDATLSLMPSLRLIGGIRYTDERKKAVSSGILDTGAPVPAINDRIVGKKVTWRAGAEVDLSAESMLYATVATGFHSGGFFATIDDPRYLPESITAYTIGIKNRFFDRKLLLNLEAFRWDFENQQFSYLGLDSGFSPTYITGNVGSSRIQGVEAQIQYRLPTDTTLSINAQYLDSKFNDFVYTTIAPHTGCPFRPNTAGPGFAVDCTAFRPPNSPKWNMTMQAEQEIRLGGEKSIELRALAHYQTATYVSFEFLPEQLQKAYWQFDAGITYTINQNLSLSGYINNITDKTVITSSLGAPYTGIIAPGPDVTGAQILPPRTYGLRLSASF